MSATLKKISETPLPDGMRYVSYDVYYPVEGLISCQENFRYTVLKFENEAKLDQFYQKIPQKVHSFFCFKRLFNHIHQSSLCRGPLRDKICILKMMPFPGYFHNSIASRLSYLMDVVCDKSAKAVGFSHRISKYESGPPLKKPGLQSKRRNIPSKSYLPKEVPPAPSTRTQKSFTFAE